MLKVLIVSRYDGPCSTFAQLVEHRLGDGSSDLRLCAGTELVDEDERAVTGLLHHHLHVHQVGGVGGEVVLQALLVADVDHHVVEDAGLRAVADRDGESALQHILQQAYRLQAHRLTAGVGS